MSDTYTLTFGDGKQIDIPPGVCICEEEGSTLDDYIMQINWNGGNIDDYVKFLNGLREIGVSVRFTNENVKCVRKIVENPAPLTRWERIKRWLKC
jgi:hypothetical protein